MMMRLAAVPVLLLALGAGASAQSAPPAPAAVPTPIPVPTLPPSVINDPIARAAAGILGNLLLQSQNAAHGTVVYFKGYDLQVQTGRNAYRNVRLHRGTVINPRGASLTPGMTVDVSGRLESPNGLLDADVVTVNR